MVERPAPMRSWIGTRRARARSRIRRWTSGRSCWSGSLLPVAGRWTAEQVHDAVALPIPDEPMDDTALFAHLREVAFDWSTYCGHPRFMAYVSGAGTVPGAAADLLAAGLNANVGGWRLGPAATEIELALTRWFARGVRVARGRGRDDRLRRRHGELHRPQGRARQPGGVERPPPGRGRRAAAHDVPVLGDPRGERAADMLGIGTDQVRIIPVDGDYRIRMDALREAVAADRAAGMQPFAVVASAGTVSTGAVDRWTRWPTSAKRRASGSTWTPRTGSGHAGRGSAPLVRGHRARGLHRVRSAQVAVHAAVGRVRAGPLHGTSRSPST